MIRVGKRETIGKVKLTTDQISANPRREVEPSVSATDPFVGKVIDGRYEIQARVGEGGMGVVYKARQMSIDRIIALKMLNPQMAGDPHVGPALLQRGEGVLAPAASEHDPHVRLRPDAATAGCS